MTGSRASLPAFTRKRVMLWTEATIEDWNWRSSLWKSSRGLPTASLDRWWLLMEYLWRTFMQMTLSLLQTPWKNASVDCWLDRRVWKGRGLEWMRKRPKSLSVVQALTYYRPKRVPMCHLPHWCKQQQYLMQRMHSLGAQEMQWAKVPLRGPKLQVL